MNKRTMNKPELLAPCGEYASAIGAFNAGADAVYLGAKSFSARAFANNFTTEEIIDVIEYGHIFGKKIYLALNILLKNKELPDAIKELKSLYENGLDGVIIQDLGLLHILPKIFPSLELHASTQMSIMSANAVDFLKEHNVTRVVPARELSLEEIKNIKAAGLEVECFIHGAMCYCYSGKCLMSSMAGGRSGNRGRCAGTCRKSYSVYEGDKCVLKDGYPLSMKDMCSIQDIGKLIDIGVDSFKIEGRMKAPQYSAGVSAIYRKYIDKYIETKILDVSKHDLNMLRNLYIRSDICDGYLSKHNGKDMITLGSPSYSGSKPEVLENIANRYLDKKMRKSINIDAYIYAGKNIIINCILDDICVSYEGPVAELASNKPTDEATIIKQLSKLGNTCFSANDINVYSDNTAFVPVSVLNECRRNVIQSLMDELIGSYRKDDVLDENLWENAIDEAINDNKSITDGGSGLIIGCKTIDQLEACLSVDYYYGVIVDLYMDEYSGDSFDDNKLEQLLSKHRNNGKNVYLRLPEVIRQENVSDISDKLLEYNNRYNFDGIYTGNIDGLGLVKSLGLDSVKLYGDNGLYVYNNVSESAVLKHVDRYTASFENNAKELKHFDKKDHREMIIYGYIPVMYSANCILKTCSSCNKSCQGNIIIKDDLGHDFKVLYNHDLCYNILYNAMPLVLEDEYLNGNIESKYCRIEFSFEDKDEVHKVLRIFNNENDYNVSSYTKGHYKRGVD